MPLKKSRSQKGPNITKSKTRSSHKSALLIGLIFSLSIAGLIFARWRRESSRPAHLSAIPQTSPTPILSKEYIYAGGRLIATEGPTFGGPAPTGLVATATSTTTVSLSWNAPTGSISSYQVERSQSINGPYTPLSPNPTTNTFTDSSASPGIAYLYRVKVIYTEGGYSDYSNKDLATTVTFIDDPLTVGITPIKASHITELRQAVNAVRATGALSASVWTDSSLTGMTIKAAHVQEIRTSLDQALSALSISLSPYTDISLPGVIVKKAHIEELRNRVK